MTITANTGPYVSFGEGTFADSNPDIGPSAWYQGDMLLDPRLPFTYKPGHAGGTTGWYSSTSIPLLDCVPSTVSASNIASAAPTAGVALALVSSSGSGVTVGLTITNALTGAPVTGVLGLDVDAVRTFTAVFTNGSPKITWTGYVPLGVQVGDSLTFTSSGTLPTGFALLTTYYVVAIGALSMMVSATPGGTPISAGSAGSGTQTAHLVVAVTNANPPVSFGTGGSGTGGPMRAWNPNWMLSRAVSVTSNADDTGGTYTIKGFDVYGYPMTQTITGLSTGAAATLKAFKYIQSVTPNGTINSTTLTVGTLDIFGLPLRADWYQYLQVMWGTPALLLLYSAGTFVPADIQTATALSGDVRGTIYGGSASDGTKRLLVSWNPQPSNMNSMVGLLGQPQF